MACSKQKMGLQNSLSGPWRRCTIRGRQGLRRSCVQWRPQECFPRFKIKTNTISSMFHSRQTTILRVGLDQSGLGQSSCTRILDQLSPTSMQLTHMHVGLVTAD